LRVVLSPSPRAYVERGDFAFQVEKDAGPFHVDPPEPDDPAHPVGGDLPGVDHAVKALDTGVRTLGGMADQFGVASVRALEPLQLRDEAQSPLASKAGGRSLVHSPPLIVARWWLAARRPTVDAAGEGQVGFPSVNRGEVGYGARAEDRAFRP
jgi:hypothetical protein